MTADPWRRLAAAVLLQAVKDATGKGHGATLIFALCDDRPSSSFILRTKLSAGASKSLGRTVFVTVRAIGLVRPRNRGRGVEHGGAMLRLGDYDGAVSVW